MKLQFKQLDIYMPKIVKMPFVLIYGQDEGAIELAGNQVSQAIGGEIRKIAFNQLSASVLFNELNSISMFNNQTLIIVEGCPITLPKDIIGILKAGNFRNKVIFIAQELPPASNIRALAEHKGASIACYKEDAQQIEHYISALFKQKQTNCDIKIIKTLAQILPLNKLLIKNEIEKLCLYTNFKNITIEDVEKVFVDAQELALDDLCCAVMLKEKSEFLRLINKISINEAMLVLRSLQKYANKVLDILNKAENNSIEKIVSELKPPVFFKKRDNLIKVCKASTIYSVQALLKSLIKVELETKCFSLDAFMLLFLELANEDT